MSKGDFCRQTLLQGLDSFNRCYPASLLKRNCKLTENWKCSCWWSFDIADNVLGEPFTICPKIIDVWLGSKYASASSDSWKSVLFRMLRSTH